ncbi:MAG: hypothetical protein ABFD07_19195 [Methanobacterium sp.]
MIDLTPSIPYIIGALLGAFTTFFGYCLNEYSKKKDKNDKRLAARRMIKFEIDHDLKLLEEFYSEIKDAAEENEGSLGYNMGNLSFPPLDKAVFNKYSFLLSDSKEKEFEKVYNFYRVLGDLQIIHSKTSKLSNKSYCPMIAKDYYGNIKELPFSLNNGEEEYSNQFSELWEDFKSIICSLIKDGNPVNL